MIPVVRHKGPTSRPFLTCTLQIVPRNVALMGAKRLLRCRMISEIQNEEGCRDKCAGAKERQRLISERGRCVSTPFKNNVQRIEQRQ